MSEASRAVFLSYASQDAEAARRIAEALRAAGVEVWFDQNELVGGDAWDAKIRRQIKECALFVPIITANTNARAEGYFRLEWKLAVDRSHLLADDHPFLFPIVVGDLNDATARVPDKFREVQWTRVRLDESPAELAARVARLLAGDVATAGAASRRDESGPEAPPAKKSGFEKWWWLIFPIMGMSVPIIGMLKRPARPDSPATPTSLQSTVLKPAAEPAKETAVPSTLDPLRVGLARFENLTGDPALDSLARFWEAELTRGLGAVGGVRLLPLEVSGRSAARSAARAAGAASVIVGGYSKRGDQLELSAEIVFVEAGELYGSLGSRPMSASAVRGDELEEFIDRLALGMEFGAGMLRFPPARLAAEIPNRPWPRRSHVLKARSIRLSDNSAAGYAAYIERYRALLAEAPDFLEIKSELARAYVGAGRFQEAQEVYRELLGPDLGRLAEAEMHSANFDEAMLLGNPVRALTSSLSLLEIRPMGDASRKVVSSLWALSRPREAHQRMLRWWETQQAKATERDRKWVEQGLHMIEAIMCHWEGRPVEALAALERQREAASGQPDFTYQTYKLAALSALGREADQAALIGEAASQPTASRAEPFHLNWLAYGLALHRGRPEEAQRWLAAATKAWDDLPASAQAQDHFRFRAAQMLSDAGRHEEAIELARKVVARSPDLPFYVGLMALVLQAAERKDEADSYLRRLEQADARFTRGQPEYWRARCAAKAGHKIRATELLQQAVARGLWLGNYNVIIMENGRNEPEFAILRGYEPYEQMLKPRG